MSNLDASGPGNAQAPLDIAAMRSALAAAMAPAPESAPAARQARALLEIPAVRRAGGLCAAAIGIWLGYAAPRMEPKVEIPHSEPAGEWLDVVKPFQLYDVASPEFSTAFGVYEAQHNLVGGGRRDVVTLGAIDQNEPYLRVAFYRLGSDVAPQPSLFVEMARRASGAGLAVDRVSAPSLLMTRFGPFETADVTVSDVASASQDKTRTCVGFRFSNAAPRFRVSGFACGQKGRPADRSAIACLIDRFDLVAAGEDEPLRAFFARAEQGRRPECFASKMAQNANWLAPQSSAPALRATKKEYAPPLPKSRPRT
jgi:hypothetical protein